MHPRPAARGLLARARLRAAGALDRVRVRTADVLDRAETVAATVRRTDTLFRLRPSGLRVIAAQQRLGHSGPSLLYRLNAATAADKVGVVDADGRRLTFAELDGRIDRLADGLRRAHGLGRRDSAVLVMRNRVELLEVQAAMARLGGGAVPVSWRSTPAELEYLVNHCGARAVFVEHGLDGTVAAARARLTAVPSGNFFVVGGAADGFVTYEAALTAAGARVAETKESGEVVIYTSGTTGKPKGAVRTFPKDATIGFLRFVRETPMRSDDRHLVVCPMYHSTAFGFLGFTLLVGGTLVIEPGFDPERFLAVVERERITTTAVVPTMLHRLLELPAATRARYDTRSLRAVFSNAAPLSGPLARRFMEAFGLVLYNCYGATEVGLATIATPEELLRSPGTIGHVVGGTDLRIVDDQGRDVPRGQTGEIYVRNSMLVAGYHRDDAATRGSMLDGYFSVGDLGHIDHHGLVHIDGRKRDMIITGGVNVYPAEVEAVLEHHPAVREAAVVGVEDAEWGERVRAFVTLRTGAASCTPAELLAHAKRELAGPKVPRDLFVLEELPKNPTGKVLKRELRSWHPPD